MEFKDLSLEVPMNEIICRTPNLAEGEELNISFIDLLLNDTWADGELYFSESLYAEIGDKNNKLPAKQNYDFLLRAAQKHPIKLIGSSKATGQDFHNTWDSFRTDCYVAAKYQQELLNTGYFNPVIETLITTASSLPNSNEAISWMEKMISHAPEYYEIDDNTRPILIYKTSDICQNLLNIFAEQLATAFHTLHQRVEIFDVQTEGTVALTRYINTRFKAIIGIQSFLFSIMMQDQVHKLHDLIIGPKFNMLLDHPAWIKDHIKSGPQNYTLLIHDRDYITFCKQYYPDNIKYEHFYPAGLFAPNTTKTPTEKIYDIVFIGSYRNYRERLKVFRRYTGKIRFIAARYLKLLHKRPNENAEQLLREVLNYYHINLNNNKFLDFFHDLREVYYCIMIYYREKVVKQLLDSGLSIHVYSNTWENAPFATHPNLSIHPDISVEESLKTMAQSRISLNVMSWHKDGFTERIANSMLCHSLVVSDKSRFLEENFENDKELILFDLKEIELLPQRIKEVLADSKRLTTLTEAGYQKAFNEHQWINRGKQLLEIIETAF